MSEIVSIKNNLCSDKIALKWRLTYICNYNCPYCIQVAQKHKESYDGDKLKEAQIAREKTASTLDKFLAKINPKGKKIKLELIGGEVTLLNIIAILKKITDKNICELSITTNGSKSLDYFYELADYLHSRDMTFCITFSYHDTQTTFSEYMYKATELNKIADEFACEYVSRADNRDNVLKFVETLEEKGIDYKIEPDKTGASIIQRMNGELIAKSNFSNRNKARYEVTLKDCDEKIIEKKYDCLVEMLNDVEYMPSTLRKSIRSKGLYCTQGYSYFYIDINDMVKCPTKDNPSCQTKTDIEDFEPLEKPIKCIYPACTGCGSMSLYKELPSDFE